ncbi:MAG TPA: aspartate--tRNA(Asn) ligase [bacterium]|nr:aspartate--tRNA(Asn) ligase [bacterium]
MARIWTTQLHEHIGRRVRLAGWFHHWRRLGQIAFLILRDGRGLAQVVVQDPELSARLDGVHRESVLTVGGVVRESSQAPGGVEVHEPSVDVVAPAAGGPPLDLSRPTVNAGLPTILDHAPVALRHPRLRAPFKLAAASMAGFRGVLRSADFVEIQTPKIVGTATESGASVFSIDYFGRRAYLAQSPQLYKQIMVGVFERVFEIGPVFRAEPHDTPRHLNEYVSMDVEMGFIDDHTTVMSVLTQVLAGMVDAIREEAAGSLTRLGIRLPDVPAMIPRLHFTEALALIARETGATAQHELDLTPHHERWLGRWAQAAHHSDYLFVVGYPMAKRPFYTHPDPARPEYANGFDLLFRGTELVTGGQRLHRYEDYVSALNGRGLSPEPLAGYLEAFKHGMPPHGGFAIGLERWVASLVGASNIREVTLFPRDQQRVSP